MWRGVCLGGVECVACGGVGGGWEGVCAEGCGGVCVCVEKCVERCVYVEKYVWRSV